jgi:diguanylate cyclase (GGDEF)-like protein
MEETLAREVSRSKRTSSPLAVLQLDIDYFKQFNDAYGHEAGDAVMKAVADILMRMFRDSDVACRYGGEEFTLILPDCPLDTAEARAEELRARLSRLDISYEGSDLAAPTMSCGIAVYPEHGHDVDTLLQRADVAMYLAKEDHSGCELYSAERDEYSPSRLALVAQLRRAIDERELVLFYQPKAEIHSGRVVGVEALVRWEHPERGLLSPTEFVPLAERTGLITDLTLYVLDAALRQIRAWHQHGLEHSVSVNLSARDLLDIELPGAIGRLMEQHGVEPGRLELEITESVILADPMRARAVLSRLNAMGIQIAIDDFGSGYSSLGYLKRLPVAVIKIDRSFVMNMEHDENDAVIVRSTIDLGRNLGLKVVAEGVESDDVWRDLARLQCDFAQGYFLSRPLPAPALSAWIRERRVVPVAAEPDPSTAAAADG